jgi:uncharacterized protein (DUF934 family)
MIILEKKNEKKNVYKLILDDDLSLDKIHSTSLLNLEQWGKTKDKIYISGLKVGIIINSDDSLKSIEKYLSTFSIIQINFKTFKDGRPFTMAKKLRKLHSYDKEIRASGYILPDQYIFLTRCGFDSVEIKEEDKDDWIEFYDMDEGLYYQP